MSDAAVRRPAVGVGIVILRGRDVLLIQRGKAQGRGQWSLPGGHQELGETVFEAAERETREETGVEIDILGVVEVVDNIVKGETGVDRHYTIIDVAALWRSGEARAGDDALAVYWAPIDGLGRFNLWSEIIRVVRMADRMRRRGPLRLRRS
ncbi:MAG: NUDIX domain-containing protein [Acetobacterales bacterium]